MVVQTVVKSCNGLSMCATIRTDRKYNDRKGNGDASNERANLHLGRSGGSATSIPGHDYAPDQKQAAKGFQSRESVEDHRDGDREIPGRAKKHSGARRQKIKASVGWPPTIEKSAVSLPLRSGQLT